MSITHTMFSKLEKNKDYDKNNVLTRKGLGKIESYLNNTNFEYP